MSAPTVTNNTTDTTAPDGTSTATKIVYPATTGGGTQYSLVQQNPSIPAGASSVTVSMWIKGTGSQTFYFSNSETNSFTTCAVTTAWQRFTLTWSSAGGGTPYINIGSDARTTAANEPGMAAQTVYIWGVQEEKSATAHSYIATTTASATGAAATFVTTAVASTTLPFLTHTGTVTSNMGNLYYTNLLPGTSIDIRSSNTSDTDMINVWLIN